MCFLEKYLSSPNALGITNSPHILFLCHCNFPSFPTVCIPLYIFTCLLAFLTWRNLNKALLLPWDKPQIWDTGVHVKALTKALWLSVVLFDLCYSPV